MTVDSSTRSSGDSAVANAVAHSALAWFRFKNLPCFRKLTEDNGDSNETPYAERLCSDVYAPFVKNSFRPVCQFAKKDERPLEKIHKAQSMADLFKEAVAMYGDRPCLGYRPILDLVDEVQPDGKVFKKTKLAGYKFHSYQDIDRLVTLYGRGLRALGVQPGQNVVLLAETRLEWMCVAQALMRQNIPIVTLYATLSDEGVLYGIRQTEATVVITTREILDKMHKSFAGLNQVEHIIYMEAVDGPRPKPIEGKTLLSLFELRRVAETAKEFHEEAPALDDTAILMYTSGSTGNPKAVILTHRNILAAAKGLGEIFDALKPGPEDAYVAYLPLAHVFELNCEMISILFGMKIGYSSALTLTDSSSAILPGHKGDCTLLQPTIMASVPLVLDRVKKSVLEKAGERGAIAQRVLSLAIDDAIRRFHSGQDATVYDRDVFARIRSVVGGRIRMVASGSAPLSPETHSFIRAALGCHVLQGYGLTETCAAATCMDLADPSTGSVGAPVNGAFVRLVDWEEGGYRVRDGRGEIVLGGDMIAKGYYKNPILTDESFFVEDGVRWFRTGDIGEVTPQGTFKIIDRKKDLVKLQHGEYVSLGKIETELKTVGLVEQICVVGSGLQTYLVALVQPNPKALRGLAAQLGKSPDTKLQLLCEDPDVVQAVIDVLQAHVKSRRFLRVEIPQKIKLCAEEWTPDSGLVTAAFKLRRKQIEERFAHDITDLYGSR